MKSPSFFRSALKKKDKPDKPGNPSTGDDGDWDFGGSQRPDSLAIVDRVIPAVPSSPTPIRKTSPTSRMSNTRSDVRISSRDVMIADPSRSRIQNLAFADEARARLGKAAYLEAGQDRILQDHVIRHTTSQSELQKAHSSHILDFGQQHSADPFRRGPSSTAPSTRGTFLEQDYRPTATSSASRVPPATEELRRMRQGKSMPHLPLEQESEERTRSSASTNKVLRRSTQYPPRPMLPQIASRGSLPPIPRQLASPSTPAKTKGSPESCQAVRASQLSTPPTSPSPIWQAKQASRSSSRTNSTTSIGHSAESSLTSFSSHHTDTSDDLSERPNTVKPMQSSNPSDSPPARIDLVSNSPPPPRPPRRKVPSPLIVKSATSRTPADVKFIRRATLAVPSLTPPQSPVPWAATDYSPTIRKREKHPAGLNPWHTPPGTPDAKFSGSNAQRSSFQTVDYRVTRQQLTTPASKRKENSGQSSDFMEPIPDLPLAAHKLPRSHLARKPVNGRTFSEGGDWSPYLHKTAEPRASETARKGKLRTQSEGATGFF